MMSSHLNTYTVLWIVGMFIFRTYSLPPTSSTHDAPIVNMDTKLRAVRGQILSKLGMNSPPQVSSTILDNIKIPSDVQQLYDISRELSQRKQRRLLEKMQEELSRYYASRVFTVDAEQLEEHPCDTWWNQIFKRSLFFSVDLSELGKLYKSDPDFFKVVYAELRLHQKPVQLSTSDQDLDDDEDLLEVYQLQNCSWTGSTKRYLGAKHVNMYESGFVGFDITEAIGHWLKNPETNMGLELTVHPGESTIYPFKTLFPTESMEVQFELDATDEDEVEVEQEKMPKIVVLFESKNNDSAEIEVHNNRKKRHDSACGPDRQDCCHLHEIYVDFQRDLGFDWIIEPKGYYANECVGSCPHLWESDVQHRQIMGLYYSVNPVASVNPCCVSRTYQGLDIMFVDETGHVKVKEMTDMSAMMCSCR